MTVRPAILVKPDGRRLVATLMTPPAPSDALIRDADPRTAPAPPTALSTYTQKLAEAKRITQEAEVIKRDALVELEGDLRRARQVVSAIELQMRLLAGDTPRRRSRPRQAPDAAPPRTCSVCGEAGHNARRHDKEKPDASKRAVVKAK